MNLDQEYIPGRIILPMVFEFQVFFPFWTKYFIHYLSLAEQEFVVLFWSRMTFAIFTRLNIFLAALSGIFPGKF